MGQLTVPRWVELCSTAPARIFSQYGRNVPDRPWGRRRHPALRPQRHHHLGEHPPYENMDYLAYEGAILNGKVSCQVPWQEPFVTHSPIADLVARFGDCGPVPQALTDYVRGREGYDYASHGKAGHTSADFVPDDIVDRFWLPGSGGGPPRPPGEATGPEGRPVRHLSHARPEVRDAQRLRPAHPPGREPDRVNGPRRSEWTVAP